MAAERCSERKAEEPMNEVGVQLCGPPCGTTMTGNNFLPEAFTQSFSNTISILKQLTKRYNKFIHYAKVSAL